MIKRAILSCFDKTGIAELGQLLQELGVEMVGTSGTIKALAKAGVKAMEMEEFTGVPEMMDGRVKSLHPKVHAGLLGIRDSKLHVEQMQAYELQWIDMVVVNLQPVEALRSKPGASAEEVFAQIDIGGAAMIRSAAKNFRYVAPVVNPDRYGQIMHELRAHEGNISFATRLRLAQEAFALTAEYDRTVAEFFRSQEPPEE